MPAIRPVEKPGLALGQTLARDSTSSVFFSHGATRCRGWRFRKSPGSRFGRWRPAVRQGRRILCKACFLAGELTNEATMSWTDERVELLRQHWLEGKSASQIANLLGPGLTRNAVIGKVHRLGLAGRAKSPGSGSAHPRQTAPRHTERRVSAPRAAAAAARTVQGA